MRPLDGFGGVGLETIANRTLAWVPDLARTAGDGDLPSVVAPTPATPPGIQRRPLAILAADIVGYCRLIELDELETALRVRHLRRYLIEPAALAHRGRVADLAGDGTLLAFQRAADAVACAVALQRRLGALERDAPADRPIRLRIGISADEVLVVDGDLYGRAVNVAARLEALAGPGDVYLSEAALTRAGERIAVRCEPLGERRLRNIAEPVRVYRVARSELAA
ncbi:MAG TPA: adenylate/guanylate cyclase domain-containing protein [Geminicoccaceae bacterium]|nr:adenylate/guanylate cyclase domain-containing protein [Geminicoccaceae bacterium]